MQTILERKVVAAGQATQRRDATAAQYNLGTVQHLTALTLKAYRQATYFQHAHRCAPRRAPNPTPPIDVTGQLRSASAMGVSRTAMGAALAFLTHLGFAPTVL
jgi:hypothetical protein